MRSAFRATPQYDKDDCHLIDKVSRADVRPGRVAKLIPKPFDMAYLIETVREVLALTGWNEVDSDPIGSKTSSDPRLVQYISSGRTDSFFGYN